MFVTTRHLQLHNFTPHYMKNHANGILSIDEKVYEEMIPRCLGLITENHYHGGPRVKNPGNQPFELIQNGESRSKRRVEITLLALLPRCFVAQVVSFMTLITENHEGGPRWPNVQHGILSSACEALNSCTAFRVFPILRHPRQLL